MTQAPPSVTPDPVSNLGQKVGKHKQARGAPFENFGVEGGGEDVLMWTLACPWHVPWLVVAQ